MRSIPVTKTRNGTQRRTVALLFSVGFGLLLTAAIAAAAVRADAVALLVKFQGDVKVQRVDAQTTIAASPGLQLNVGDKVVVARGAEAVVLYRTGKLVKAAADVTIEQQAETASSTLFSNTVRTLGQVATTDARTQPNRQGMIRPIAGAPVPISPRNQVKLLEVRPTFTWFSVPGAKYVVQLQREGTDSPRPKRFAVGTDTVWTLPHSEAPLVPGATYVWTVGGEGIGRVAETMKFTVASAEDIATLQQTMNGLIEAGIDPATDGLFLTALAYRDAGLFYEALRALDAIATDGNGIGRAFYMLRGEVYDALGRVDDAEESFKLADQVSDT